MYHHESRNLSVLHLDDEEKDITMFDDFDIHMDLKLSKHNEDDGTLKEGLVRYEFRVVVYFVFACVYYVYMYVMLVHAFLAVYMSMF